MTTGKLTRYREYRPRKEGLRLHGGRNGSITDVAVKKLKGMHKGLILLAYIFSHAVIVFSAVWADQQRKFDYTFFGTIGCYPTAI